jgi:aminoglycoside phosphotransferase (APT) family kinase protein
MDDGRRCFAMLDVRRLDSAALSAILNGEFAVESVEVIERARCGDGAASTADRILLRLSYAPGCTETLPTQMVLKTLLLHPVLRFGLPAILSLASVSRAAERLPLIGAGARSALFVLVGLYQRLYPHAPDPMYMTEARFYREIRPELDLEIPRTFGSVYDTRSRQFAILMEDLRLRGARFPNAMMNIPVEQVRALVTLLARLHAQYWQCPRFERELAWVPTRLSGGMFPVFDGIGLELIRYQVESNPFKQRLLAPLERSVDELWSALWRSQRRLAEGPQTLLHGDTHIGNAYLLPDGTGGFYDWQLMARGHWANDLTYLLCSGLAADVRREHERGLINHYLASLADAGVKGPPTPQEAWECYRLAAIWGLVIGWLITPPVNYGVEITTANISRMVDATIDLASFEASC